MAIRTGNHFLYKWISLPTKSHGARFHCIAKTTFVCSVDESLLTENCFPLMTDDLMILIQVLIASSDSVRVLKMK